MRCCALLLATALLVAADPDPAAFIPADAQAAIRLPDLTRSRARWPATPYPRLLQTGWGVMMTGEWGSRLDQAIPGAATALDGLNALAVAAIMMPGRPPAVVVAGSGPPLLAGLAGVQFPQVGEGGTRVTPGGRLSLHGAVVAWASGPGGAIAPEAKVRAPVDGEADAEIVLRPTVAGAAGGSVRIDLRLDAVGLRETATLTATPASIAAATAAARWADPQELRRLPATTLWAATWNADPVITGPLLAAQDVQGMAMMERWLAEAGLPGWAETMRGLDGPATVWMGEGIPFPSLTAALSMPEPLARRWIAAAAAALHLTPTPEGADGFVGLTHLALGVLNGRLVITSDPTGLDAWKLRKPGFADHAGVSTVLTKVPPRTALLGASRGGASWAAIAQLAVPVFTAMGAPQAVALPVDLKTAADRGWIYATLPKDGAMRIESGGLFGGPFTIAMGGATTTAATIWLQQELRRQKRIPAAEPGEAPAPPPAPMF